MGREDNAGETVTGFECSMMQMTQRMSQRLSALMVWVNESSGSSTETQSKTSSSALETCKPLDSTSFSGSGRCWADIPVD